MGLMLYDPQAWVAGPTDPVSIWIDPNNSSRVLGFTLPLHQFMLEVKMADDPLGNYPRTPLREQTWRVGWVQNVIQQSLKVHWTDINGGGVAGRSSQSNQWGQALDGIGGHSLPFYGEWKPSEGEYPYQEFRWSPNGVWWFRAGRHSSQSQDIRINYSDGPFTNIFTYRNTDPNRRAGAYVPTEVLTKVQQSITFQAWVLAMPYLFTRSYVLGRSDRFTLTSTFDRSATVARMAAEVISHGRRTTDIDHRYRFQHDPPQPPTGQNSITIQRINTTAQDWPKTPVF